MSDSDDWEKEVEDILEDKKEEEKKEDGKFQDEDAVDSDEEREKAAAEAKKRKEEQDAQPKKQKAGKKDYEKMFAERQGKGAAKASAMTAAGLKGEQVSRAAEEDITD